MKLFIDLGAQSTAVFAGTFKQSRLQNNMFKDSWTLEKIPL